MADNDYIIEIKDKEFLTIKTGIRDLVKVYGRYFLTFAVRDKSISVTGQTNADVSHSISRAKSESNFELISNSGAKFSYMGIAFLKMKDFASKLGRSVEYVTE